MSKAKARTPSRKRSKRTGAKGRTPVDIGTVRDEIDEMVGSKAVKMVEQTIGEVGKGHYGAMKYLFEMIGLYPATKVEAPKEDSLAKTLLKRLGLPEGPALKAKITNEYQPDGVGDDAVE